MAKFLISEPLPPEQIVGRSLQYWALALDVSTRHLYRQIERGRLRVFKIGNRTIATPDDIRKMLHAGAIDAEVGKTAVDAAPAAQVQDGAGGAEAAVATPGDEPAELCASSAGVVR
jgi:hypothetical protein